jgi:hypothetical protein
MDKAYLIQKNRKKEFILKEDHKYEGSAEN